MTADGEDIDAGPGDIVVVGPETPHEFENAGTEPLDIICVHVSRPDDPGVAGLTRPLRGPLG